MARKKQRLGPGIYDRAGEVRFDDDVVQRVINSLNEILKTPTFNYIKLRRLAATRLNVNGSFLNEIISVPRSMVNRLSKTLDLADVTNLDPILDVESGVYEGGFKVWEATSDLVHFITRNADIMSEIFSRNQKLNCLELGAGSGIASLALISRIISEENFDADYRIHLQDYNWQVLASFTLVNFAVNLEARYLESLIANRWLRFFHGDWMDFGLDKSRKYDLIILSEAIYNSDNYQTLHDLFDRHLGEDGYIILATKDTYFGLSGGIYSWIDYLANKNVFGVFKLIKICKVNIPRSILVIRRASKLRQCKLIPV